MQKSDKTLMRKILRNQTAIANALAIEIPFPVGNDEATDPFLLLPPELRRMLDTRGIDVFRNAFVGEEALFTVINGTIMYNYDKPVLAAYFFGRLFCGDRPERGIDIDIWRQGPCGFPKSLIAECFGNMDFRESRQNKLNKTLPQNAYLVDRLFDI